MHHTNRSFHKICFVSRVIVWPFFSREMVPLNKCTVHSMSSITERVAEHYERLSGFLEKVYTTILTNLSKTAPL